MTIIPGKIYTLKYGLYHGCVEVIPSGNHVKVTAHLRTEEADEDEIRVVSVESAGIHGGREITVSAHAFGHATGICDEPLWVNSEDL